MNSDPLEDYFKDPDKRAKLYLIITGAMILTTILITIGYIIFILWALGLINI